VDEGAERIGDGHLARLAQVSESAHGFGALCGRKVSGAENASELGNVFAVRSASESAHREDARGPRPVERGSRGSCQAGRHVVARSSFDAPKRVQRSIEWGRPFDGIEQRGYRFGAKGAAFGRNVTECKRCRLAEVAAPQTTTKCQLRLLATAAPQGPHDGRAGIQRRPVDALLLERHETGDECPDMAVLAALA
jgi:hypothetical protein